MMFRAVFPVLTGGGYTFGFLEGWGDFVTFVGGELTFDEKR